MMPETERQKEDNGPIWKLTEVKKKKDTTQFAYYIAT